MRDLFLQNLHENKPKSISRVSTETISTSTIDSRSTIEAIQSPKKQTLIRSKPNVVAGSMNSSKNTSRDDALVIPTVNSSQGPCEYLINELLHHCNNNLALSPNEALTSLPNDSHSSNSNDIEVETNSYRESDTIGFDDGNPNGSNRKCMKEGCNKCAQGATKYCM